MLSPQIKVRVLEHYTDCFYVLRLLCYNRKIKGRRRRRWKDNIGMDFEEGWKVA